MYFMYVRTSNVFRFCGTRTLRIYKDSYILMLYGLDMSTNPFYILQILDCTFELAYFQSYIRSVPIDTPLVTPNLHYLMRQPPDHSVSSPYLFIGQNKGNP